MLVGIKYCGGCNPDIDRGIVTGRLAEELKKFGHSLELYNILDCDIVVVINGCPVGCAEGPMGVRTVTISGTFLEMIYTQEDNLPQETAKRVLNMIGIESK